MCEQTEIPYRDGDVVWVKLGKCFWPGQVRDIDKLEEDITESFKKKPIAAVQFFEEDKYEFVKNLDQISLYNGRKKMDFIKKGLDMYQKQKANSTFMNKFPEDVKKAEILTGGDPNILSDPHFSPKEKTSYRGLFDNNKSSKKDKAVSPKTSTISRTSISSSTNGRKSTPATAVRTPPRPITHPRFVRGETDHEVRIRDQQISSVPSTPEESESPGASKPKTNEPYKCQLCDFTSNRLNVIVLHSKFHSGDAANQSTSKGSTSKGKTNKLKSSMTPSPAAKPRGRPKGKSKVTFEESKPLPKIASPVSNTTKPTSPLKTGVKRKILEVDDAEKTDEETVQVTKPKAKESPEKKIHKTPEKLSEKKSPKSAILGKRKGMLNAEKAMKKSKNDEEIREKLLADWDDEDTEQEEREVELLKKKPPKDINDLNNKTTASCFDFDDSKDAILDSELEERAKKFVEGRKIPRLTDDKFERMPSDSDVDMPKTELLPLIPEATFLDNPSKTETTTNADDFVKAIDSLLDETQVPALPAIPKSSGILPDVVLDSNMIVVNNVKNSQVPEETIAKFSGVDHDYSATQIVENEGIEYGDILDINSMPVVMTDDILTEEATTSQVSQMPKIDLIPGHTQTIVFSESEIKMPTSVKSLVKAVRTSTADRSKVVSNTVISLKTGGKLTALGNTITIPTNKLTPLAKKQTVISKGTAGGKYIIVQSPSGQQSRLTLAPQSAADKPVAGSSQHQMQAVSGGKVVILTKPQGQQKILTALTPAQQKTLTAGKLPPTQRIMTSSGQILTPVNPRTRMPLGSKLTPITSQQMRLIAPIGKPGLVSKLTMQSLQTKVCLPSMQSLRQPAAGIRMVTTQKPQSNTILIQSPQTQSLLVSKPATTEVQTKTVIPSNQMSMRPRLLTSPMTVIPSGKPMRTVIHPKILQTRSTLQPRMMIQRARSPSVGVVAGMQPAYQVPGLASQSQVIHKISQPQTIMKMIPQPRKNLQPIPRAAITQQTKPFQLAPRQKTSFQKQSIQKASIISTIPSPHTTSSNTIELLTSQSLPLLTPLQSTSDNIALSLPQTLPSFQSSSIDTSSGSVLTAEQLAQVMASTSANQLGDAGATYVLLTIDDAGNLQHLNNPSLIGYDGSDQSGGQTFYIDSSSLETGGDLNNMILTIDNSTAQSGSGLAMDLGETNTNWIPSTSQDILAAALANTDVFQTEQDSHPCVVDTSSLLASIPSTILLPSLNRNVTSAANVSETSLTLNQPIMSPLEVTSAVTSFRAPPITTARIPTPMYTPISEPLLIQPIMSTMEVASNIVQTNVQAMYTTGNEHLTTTESLPGFHPSMPLLSEEPLESPALDESHNEVQESSELPALTKEEQTVSYEQFVLQGDNTDNSEPPLDQTTADTSGKSLTDGNVDLSNFSHEFLNESGQNDQVVIATTDSYEPSVQEIVHSEEPIVESDLNSDMLQTFHPNDAEPECPTEEADSNAIPHSMPLLSDDPVSVDNAVGNVLDTENTLNEDDNQVMQECETNEVELHHSEV